MRKKTTEYPSIKPSQKELDFMHSWEHKRALPRWKYVLLQGILKEALIFFIGMKTLQFLFVKDGFSEFYASFHGIFFLVFEIIFWIFGGYVIGWLKYNSKEIEYELLKGLDD